jgi:hypothetical protein
MIMAWSLLMAGLLGSVTKVETSVILANRGIMPNISEWRRLGETIRYCTCRVGLGGTGIPDHPQRL